MAVFPSSEWVTSLMEKLNTDAQYAQVAHNWEGDMKFLIEPGGALKERKMYYLDLWHGKCRAAYEIDSTNDRQAAFTLKAPYDNFVRVLKGELDPLQAMLTRKLGVQGNMMVMMRSVPTVLDFVRCCRENTDSYLGHVKE
jgi:putative sterol carrier protein